MMMGVNLVNWRSVAPAYCLVLEPIKAVFAHSGKNSKLVRIDKDDQCNWDRYQYQHISEKERLFRHLAHATSNYVHGIRTLSKRGPRNHPDDKSGSIRTHGAALSAA